MRCAIPPYDRQPTKVDWSPVTERSGGHGPPYAPTCKRRECAAAGTTRTMHRAQRWACH